jgi:hypothetical protein
VTNVRITAAKAFVAEVVRLMHETGFPDQDCFQLVLSGTAQEIAFPPRTDVSVRARCSAHAEHGAQFVTASSLNFTFALLDPLRVANGALRASVSV